MKTILLFTLLLASCGNSDIQIIQENKTDIKYLENQVKSNINYIEGLQFKLKSVNKKIKKMDEKLEELRNDTSGNFKENQLQIYILVSQVGQLTKNQVGLQTQIANLQVDIASVMSEMVKLKGS